jgi:hypothetical protein
MLAIESGLVVAAILVALIFPTAGSRWFDKVERALAKFARRRTLATVAVGFAALALRAALLPVEPMPQPAMHDEFGYLLAADTFAHGRVTNPAHPMWIHFESITILQKPTYCSVFYPAQGLFLAAGQVFFGHPFWGLWLSLGLMCGAICWMLQGWLPPPWALLGGALAVIRLAAFSYWANNYMGGAVAAFGGALVLGALPRIMRHHRTRDALLMGLGLAIVANSRPYEGLFLGLPVGVALLVWILGKKAPPWSLSLRRVVLPLGLVLAVTAGAMLYYFWRTTGNPFRAPYFVNLETYFFVPNFPWSPLRPVPQYHHASMRDHYLKWHPAWYYLARSKPGVLILIKAFVFWLFFLCPALTLPLVAATAINPQRYFWQSFHGKLRLLLIVFCGSCVGLLLPIYFTPHYAAPITCVLYALLLQALRSVRLWEWHGERSGLLLVRAVPVICLVMLIILIVTVSAGGGLPKELRSTWYSSPAGNLDRAEVLAQLQRQAGLQLVLVRYKPGHEPLYEWVYNDADIDAAKIVWAREMSPAENQELIKYFHDRRVWLLEADEKPPQLSRYPTENVSRPSPGN